MLLLLEQLNQNNELMRQQLEQRLKQLKIEYESGQKVLADLETKQTQVQHTLLRIQGAIQVLEEELLKQDQNNDAVSELTKIEILETEEVR